MKSEEHQTSESKIANEQIKVKIRTMDQEFMIDINSNDKIENLKKKIETFAKVPFDRQRLIFRGKLLKNEDTLTSCKITNEDVVHLVAKIGNINEQSENNRTEQNTSSNPFQRSSGQFIGLMNQLFRERRPGPPFRRPLSSEHGRRSRNFVQEPIPVNFNGIECREAVSQNLVSINEMIICGNYSNKNKEEIDFGKAESFNCYDFDKRQLVKGQWVDVRDTVEQWLEGQVIDINKEKKEVHIHYNGWGTRWDEWIAMNSPRIMPFRFHTKQNEMTNYHSPTPNKSPDANITLVGSSIADKNRKNSDVKNNSNSMPVEIPENNVNAYVKGNTNSTAVTEDFNDIFNEIQKINRVSNELMENIINCKDNMNSNLPVEKKQMQLETMYNIKKMIPLFDKVGRLYTDTSTYLNFAIRNNKLNELNHHLFDDSQSNDLLRQYTQEELKNVTEEMKSAYTERESRSGTINFIPPVNPFDRKFKGIVPALDTPLTISNRNSPFPSVDIYVHTFVSPHIEHRRSSTEESNPPSDIGQRSQPTQQPEATTRETQESPKKDSTNTEEKEDKKDKEGSQGLSESIKLEEQEEEEEESDIEVVDIKNGVEVKEVNREGLLKKKRKKKYSADNMDTKSKKDNDKK